MTQNTFPTPNPDDPMKGTHAPCLGSGEKRRWHAPQLHKLGLEETSTPIKLDNPLETTIGTVHYGPHAS